jgi:hypothetical protein
MIKEEDNQRLQRLQIDLMEHVVLAEELMIIDADSPLWFTARPLLDAALRLEQHNAGYIWHGWNKEQIDAFLNGLPSPCSLLAGVWQTEPAHGNKPEEEKLAIGIVCEVVEGEVCSLRTFGALTQSGLKPASELEAGFEDAVAIMRAAKSAVAPVAWALFTDISTWNTWIFGDGDAEVAVERNGVVDKGELLARLARQGKCVLMGSQTARR